MIVLPRIQYMQYWDSLKTENTTSEHDIQSLGMIIISIMIILTVVSS